MCDFGMSRVEEYLQRATLVEASAQEMSLAEHRRQLLEAAARWRELAEQERRREEAASPPGETPPH